MLALGQASSARSGPLNLPESPAKVGQRDGYRQTFGFTNQSGPLTAEVAAVLSGPTASDVEGNHEFSVVLVWVTRKPGAPLSRSSIRSSAPPLSTARTRALTRGPVAQDRRRHLPL
jgi:hypothetical protein